MMEKSLSTQRLDFLDELDTLNGLAKEIGDKNPYYERLVASIENLYELRYVFVYAEYMDDCAKKTPKRFRELVSIYFKHKNVKDFVTPSLPE